MGKVMIIKNADFQENALEKVYNWLFGYSQEDYDLSNKEAVPSYGTYAPTSYPELQNHIIYKIKIKPSSSGVLTICKSDTLSGTLVPVTTINIPESDIGTITEYDVHINVGSSIISLLMASDTASFSYYSASPTTGTADYISRVGTNAHTIPNVVSKLLVDYKYV